MMSSKKPKPIQVWSKIVIPFETWMRALMPKMDSVMRKTQIRYKWNSGSVRSRARFEGDWTGVWVRLFFCCFKCCCWLAASERRRAAAADMSLLVGKPVDDLDLSLRFDLVPLPQQHGKQQLALIDELAFLSVARESEMPPPVTTLELCRPKQSMKKNFFQALDGFLMEHKLWYHLLVLVLISRI